MKHVISCLQMTSSNDVNANVAMVERMLHHAAKEKPSLIATPENTFFMRSLDTDTVPTFAMEEHPGVLMCQTEAKKMGIPILIGSLFVPAGEGKFFNRSVLIDAKGNIASYYDKIHLFDAQLGEGNHYQESARVMPGGSMKVADVGFATLGMSICYDVRFAHLYRDLALAGANLIAVPAAFTVPTGEAHWHVLLRARAIETGAYVIAPAQCGTHVGGRMTFGHSLIIDPWGKILSEGGMDPSIISAEIDLAVVDATHKRLPSLKHARKYSK
ncbi:MAG: carbon-nitrogen hydrolase family protein [Rickettsiales bacterium]